jgi:hypothetical protein
VNPAAPLKTFWATFPDEAGKGVYGSQPLIAGRDCAFPLFFEVMQKVSKQVRRDVGNQQPICLPVELGCCEKDQQAHCIAVASLSVSS